LKAEFKSDLDRDSAGHSADLQQLELDGLYRKERILNARQGVEIEIDGNRLINFCSNDYLGLANHPRIARAMQDAAVEFGTGSSASPLVSGKTVLHRSLEEKLADVTKRDRVLLMSCGYMANLAIVAGLVSSRNQWIFEDRLCHASMVDAARLSGARLKRYTHASPASLEGLLGAAQRDLKLVLTESVFSMDGDLAPLHELSGLCRKHRACLVVDDAHGFGVLGNNGLGGLDHFSLDQSAVPLLMATFGKALGTYGAFIAGPAALIETLVQRARTYIYTTSLPAPLAAAAHEALKVHEDEPERRDHLASRIRRFRSGVRQLGIKTTSAETPIQPVIIGDSKKTQLASRMLEQNGLFISAIRPPTVPRNSSRLRITLSAGHTDEQIDRLLDGLNKCIAIGLI